MGSNVIHRYDSPLKPQNLCPGLVKSSQSNFNLLSPDCYLVCSYLIVAVTENYVYAAYPVCSLPKIAARA